MLHFLLLAFAPVLAASVVLTPVAVTAQSGDWNVNRNASEIGFSGTHAGREFDGEFGQWTARIRFNPDSLGNSRIVVVVDTGTATTGDRVQETTLKNAEWFDSANNRFATFTSTNIRSRGGNRYTADGTLEIKGKKVPVTLPFTVAINGNNARANGTLTLDRVALGMGTKSDPKAQWVSRNINLNFQVAATRG